MDLKIQKVFSKILKYTKYINNTLLYIIYTNALNTKILKMLILTFPTT